MLGLISELKFQHIKFKEQSVSKLRGKRIPVICIYFNIINQAAGFKTAHIQHDGA